MYIRSKSSKNSPRKTVQIVESFLNEKGQPRQRIVQHVGVAFDEEQLHKLWTTAEYLIPELQRRAQEEKLFKNGQLPLFVHSPDAYESKINDDQTARIKKMLKQEDVLEGPFEVWGEVFDKLGIDDFLGLSDRGRGSTHALRLCLFAKLNDGGSKRRSAWWLTQELGLKLSEARFYRMMDKLALKIEKVKELALRCGSLLCGNKVSLLLFDVTTLYFESFIDDEDVEVLDKEKENQDSGGIAEESRPRVRNGLRRHGFSKDRKVQETQVVLALATSSEGIPLWYDLFPGNTAECSTLKVMMDEVAKRVNPEEMWVVADGAMLMEDNRKILKEAKASYVLGASVKKLSQVHQEEALNLASFKDLGEGKKYRTIDLKSGNTVIVTWSESKAKRDVHKREQLIKRLLKKLDKKGEIKTKTVIGNRGTSKYIEPSNGQEECKYRLNQGKIEEDARYDGLHAVETDRQVKNEEDVHAVLNAYGNLWHIEDCFRVTKSDLEIRPMYHWTSKRIESHVAICFLALLMERYLQSQLKVRRRKSMSAQCIKDALSKVNSTLIKDTEQDKLYRFPSRLSKEAREIYKALGLKRGVEATEITSVVNYRRRIPNIRGEVYEDQEESNNLSRV